MAESQPIYEGHVDLLDDASIFGWAWQPDRPNQPVSVDLFVDSQPEGSFPAGLYRQDLAAAGKGTGFHAFQIRLPDRYRDGTIHLIQVRFHGTDLELSESPRSVALLPKPELQSDSRAAERRARLDARVRNAWNVSSTEQPRVSVIIPCFNVGHYLDETVDSVLQQTFQDFEILVVDDGSTDRVTCDLIDRYDRPKTRVFPRPHQGVSATRNYGVAQSRGEYLCFLDADDILDPLFLEKTIAPLRTDPSVAFVSCWLRTFGSEDWTWRQTRCDLSALLAECTVLTAAPVRRSVVEEVGGFDPALGELFAEDWDLWISIVERGHRGVILPEVLFRYRRYAESNSRRWDDPAFVGRVSQALVERHEAAYREHLFDVLLLKERRVGDCLETNYDLQREEHELVSRIARQKEEVDRLGRRLMASNRADCGRAITWGDLDRTTPLSSIWGFDRGTPVDRYYIEGFLRAHAADIRGDVLEVGDAGYTRQFGGDRVQSTSVVDIRAGNPAATVVADLRDARSIPSASFDCFIMTQTAYLIDDIGAVLSECARILRPGGVLLATLPCAIRLEPDSGLDNDFWRVGPHAAGALFARAFPADRITVTSYGNLLATIAFSYGLACEELTTDELEAVDPRFPLTVGIRAVAGEVELGTGAL